MDGLEIRAGYEGFPCWCAVTIELIPITPSRFKTNAFARLFIEAVEETIDASEDGWDDITETWKRQPDFEKTIKETKSEIKGEHSSGDDLIRWLTKGTPPHIIRPVNADVLVFQSGYQRKTTPGVIGSTTGGASGDLIFAKEVRHPGTKAGNWDKVIAKEQRKEFPIRVQHALDLGARMSGHSI